MKARIIALTLSTSFLALASGCDDEPALETEPAPETEPTEPTEALGAETESAEFVAPIPERVQPGVTVTAVAMDVQCRPGVIFFDTDSAELDDDAVEMLAGMAECLKGTPQDEDVTVRGRTDPRASEDYNEALARQRATAVVSYLQTHGVSESDFEIIAVGEDGATEEMPRLHPFQRNATVRPQ